MNAAATAATASPPGCHSADVAESLRSIDRLSPWRMEVHERADGLVVVNDAYNANPDSMAAALETLARMGERAGRRTVAVLGEMRELGGSAAGGAPRGRRARAASGHRRGRGRRATAPGAIYDALVDARGDDGTTRHVDTVEQAGSGCARMWRVPTSSWSRRRGPGGSSGSPTMLAGRRPGAIWERRRADDHPTQSRVQLAALARDTIPRGPRMRAILLAGGLSLLFTLVGTRYAIRVLAASGYGQLIRDDGPTTHHTKRGTPTMGGLVIVLASVAGVLPRHLHHRQRAERLGAAAAVPVRRARHGRLPRRLHQDLPAAQPRPAQPGEVHRPDLRRAGLRLAGALAVAGGRPRADPRRSRDLLHPRPAYLHAADDRAGAVHLAADRRGEQRGQPHRRARRPGRRSLGDDVRRLHDREHLAEQPVVRPGGGTQVLRGARPARPGRRGRGDHRRVLRLPVVERVAGQDLHG